jgi:CheY-like chemotaxis protein
MISHLPILLVDDNPLWRETLAEYLQRKGFPVVTAEGGQPGLALLERNGIPVAVVDFNMPGMNGLELLRRLRERHRHVAVFLLSGEDDPSLPERARAAGARGFLSKTTSPRQLLRRLVEALEAVQLEVALIGIFSPSGLRLLPGPRRPTHYLPPPSDTGTPH